MVGNFQDCDFDVMVKAVGMMGDKNFLSEQMEQKEIVGNSKAHLCISSMAVLFCVQQGREPKTTTERLK